MGLNNDLTLVKYDSSINFKIPMLCSICHYDKFLCCVAFVIMMTKSNINIYCTYIIYIPYYLQLTCLHWLAQPPMFQGQNRWKTHFLTFSRLWSHRRIYFIQMGHFAICLMTTIIEMTHILSLAKLKCLTNYEPMGQFVSMKFLARIITENTPRKGEISTLAPKKRN